MAGDISPKIRWSMPVKWQAEANGNFIYPTYYILDQSNAPICEFLSLNNPGSIQVTTDYLRIQNGSGNGSIVAVGPSSSDFIDLYSKNSAVRLFDISATVAPALRFYNAASTQYTAFKVATSAATTVTFTLPSADGSTSSILKTDGSGNLGWSVPTFPVTASATAGKVIISDGTNWVASTPTYPNTSVTAGKVLVSDGTNFVASTPTFPNASATARKIIVSDGTNWTASTETWAVPGTSGNVLVSNGTNWTSAALTAPYITNRILDGDFRFDQPNEGTSVTILTTTGAVTDAWSSACTVSSKFSMQKTTTALGSIGTSLLVTSAAATTVNAGDLYVFYQGIEANDMGDWLFGTANAVNLILTFTAKSSVTGTYNISLENAASNRSYPATFSLTANTAANISLSIPGDTSGTWLSSGTGVGAYLYFNMGTGTTFSGTANTWNAGNFTGSTGATQLVATNGATFSLNNVRLYPGTVAQTVYQMPYSEELLKIQRRYRKSFPAGTVVGQNKGVAGSINIKNPIALGDPAQWIPFDPQMRISPTVTTYNPSVTNANWRDITAAADVTVSVDPGSSKNTSGVLIATSGTVSTLGDVLAIHYTADARI